MSVLDGIELPKKIEFPDANLMILMFLVGLMLMNVAVVVILGGDQLSAADSQLLHTITIWAMVLLTILVFVFVYNHVQFWQDYFGTNEADWE